jgi:hypothetical protein
MIAISRAIALILTRREWTEKWIYSSSIHTFLSGSILMLLFAVTQDFLILGRNVGDILLLRWLLIFASCVLAGMALLYYRKSYILKEALKHNALDLDKESGSLMEDSDLQTLLGKMWESSVTHMEYDLNAHTLQLGLSFSNKDTTTTYDIKFDGISSLYFVNGPGKSRFNTNPWVGVALNGIEYHPDRKINISVNKPTGTIQEDWTSANFVLEFWHADLFIEAKGITINGQHFSVESP